MSQWPMVKLGDVCDIKIGKTPARKNKAYWGEGTPWLSIKDMNQGPALSTTSEQITNLAVQELKITPYPPGTVFFSFKLSIGKVGISTIELFTNEAIAAIVPKDPTSLDKKFLMEALRLSGNLISGNDAVLGQTLNNKSLQQISIPLPPLEEQRRIARILNSSTSTINNSRHEIELLYNLRNSQFAPSETSQNVHLSELITIRSGQVDPTLPDYQNQLHVAPDSINSNYSTFNEIRTCAEDGVISGKYKFSSGDILYSKIRPYLNKVAIPSFDGVCSADMYVIEPKPGISSEYVRAILMSPHFLAYAEKESGRASIPKINRKALLSYSLPKPSEEDISVTTTRIREIDDVIAKKTRQMKLMEELHQSLATRAFAGQL